MQQYEILPNFQPTMGAGEKIIWTIAALFFSILTAIIYYFMRMK
ncbi:MAG: PLDc N-terminal domain-containing protein [Cyclonatronaceae bacterium]